MNKKQKIYKTLFAMDLIWSYLRICDINNLISWNQLWEYLRRRGCRSGNVFGDL